MLDVSEMPGELLDIIFMARKMFHLNVKVLMCSMLEHVQVYFKRRMSTLEEIKIDCCEKYSSDSINLSLTFN